MNTKQIEILVGGLFAVTGIFALAYLIPNYVQEGFGGGGLSPRVLPYVCAAAITVLSVLLVMTRVRKQGRSEDQPIPISLFGLIRLAGSIGALLLSLALMEVSGYIAGGAMLVALFMLAMGERRPLPIILTAFVWTTLLWALFEKGLATPLP